MCKIECITIHGKTQIADDSLHQFDAVITFKNCEVADKAIKIGLHYRYSKIHNNVHYFAPNEVIVLEGRKSVRFNIYTNTQCNAEDDNLIEITPYVIEYDGSKHEKTCGAFRTRVVCDEVHACDDGAFWDPYRHNTKKIRDFHE